MDIRLAKKEIDYRLAVLLIKVLLYQGYLEQKEYDAVSKKLLKKYQPPLGELW